MKFETMSDEDLVRSLRSLCDDERRLLARLLALLIELEERRVHLDAACPSLFEFCVERIGMSESEANRRIAAARVVKRFPSLLPYIERGELHLTHLLLLRDHLRSENVEDLVAAARGKSKRELQTILAARVPKPDVPPTISRIPHELVLPAPRITGSTSPRSEVTPLSPERHAVRFTASEELRRKIERAKQLTRHRNPRGDLAILFEQALDAWLVKLESQVRGKTARPQRAPRASRPALASARPSQLTKRAVFERDGEQCTFVDGEGHRCGATAMLELDHVTPRAHGGSAAAENLRVLCRAHNQRAAEQVFGAEKIRSRVEDRKRERARGADVAAKKGLVSLGFREVDAKRALAAVHAAAPEAAPSVSTLIRSALPFLT